MAYAQGGRVTVTGTVTDASNLPIPGVTVTVDGTDQGTTTDVDGKYSIEVTSSNVLTFSFIGYASQSVAVGARTTIDVQLAEDTQALDEVVVVGYGTQAKKDITGSVAVVSRDAIAEQPVSSFAEALQGRAAGVTITNAGGPAGDSQIRIRGVGSVNGSDPLIIVDGVQGVNISSVNPNDIESMQVLKDAAATAIYGARAANGVIIVTTKQGNKEGKVRVSYNGYISLGEMANDGYNTLGAWDYMKAEEFSQWNQVNYRGVDINSVGHDQFGSIKNGELKMPYTIVPSGLSKEEAMARWGSYEGMVADYDGNGSKSWALSAYYYIKEILGGTEEEARAGTQWFDMVTQTAVSHNHELSINGGGQNGMYSISFGYLDREGTIKESAFERYSVRANSTFNAGKHVTFGLNMNTSVQKRVGEMGGQGDDSTFARTYTMNMWVPAYNVGGEKAGSRGNGGRAQSALASIENARGDWSRNFRMQASAFMEIKDPWIKGLSLKTQFSTSLNGAWSIGFGEKTIAWNKEGTSYNSFSESGSWSFNWQWTNTATYKHTFADDHDMTIMIGTEALKNGIGRNISASRNNYIFPNDPNTWVIDNGDSATVGNSGGQGGINTMFGLFARGDYSYKGKYLVTATFRRDASSRFAAKHRWGNFPSVSLGWRISDESFLAKAHDNWLDDLKIRAGYGTTGNSNIGNYNFATQYSNATQYLYGIAGGNSGANVGFATSYIGDTEARWETVEMFNVGADLTAFRNRLTAGVDFYVKKTSDMLVPASWTILAGTASKPNVNMGDMKNTGVDFQIGWRDKIGQFSYNISANASWYKNEVVRLGASDLYTSTRINQMAITTEGQPIGMFYGYVLDGIYTSVNDVINYGKVPYGVSDQVNPKTGNLIWHEDAANQVGHYRFKDLNNDGKITDADREMIGNPHPDVTGGVNIGLGWKNWDLSTYLYYTIGNDLYAHYQLYTNWGQLANVYTYERLENAWHPEQNPNGTLPMFVRGDTHAETNVSHTGYIQDGSYLRMQTLTLGYTLPKKWLNKIGMSRIRFYAQMSNVFTITGYEGLDPEVYQGSDRSRGIDYGSYGMPRQYLFGVNIDF
ncbi:MAG: TonB-dependent receptor [Rikenellaceae bacterium]|nr:TonB-dependent receptor [Rikenellaceae bacterium]